MNEGKKKRSLGDIKPLAIPMEDPTLKTTQTGPTSSSCISITASNFFIAMLSAITISVNFLPIYEATNNNCTYWAYIPKLPLLCPVT